MTAIAPDRDVSARAISGRTDGTYDVEYFVRNAPRVIHVDLYRRVAAPDPRPADDAIARGRAMISALASDASLRIDGDYALRAVPGGGAKACEFRLVEINALGQHRGVVAEIYVAAHSRSAVALWDRCYGAAIGLHRPAAPWYATRLCRGPDPWVAELARSLAWAVIER